MMEHEPQAEVILVHGLWFGPWAMARLAQKLESAGFSVRRFGYASTTAHLDEHSQKLQAYAQTTTAQRLHFVGHSLGGLVILNMLNRSDTLPPGRISLLGSPLDGSIVARRTKNLPGADRLLGEVRVALEKGYGRIPAGRETGMISGTRALGLGTLLGGAGKPGDGTVSVAETRTSGLKDHLLLPVNHTGLVYSSEVARQAAIFLRTGSFDWPAAC